MTKQTQYTSMLEMAKKKTNLYNFNSLLVLAAFVADFFKRQTICEKGTGVIKFPGRFYGKLIRDIGGEREKTKKHSKVAKQCN